MDDRPSFRLMTPGSRFHMVRSLAENTLSLNKTLILFSLVVGALIITAVFATMPQSGRLEARERTPQAPCRTEQVSLDQGYGVSRIVERRVCDDY